MRVLLLSTYYLGGGAAVAVRRLFNELQKAGVEVRLLTAEPIKAQDSTPQAASIGGCARQVNRVAERLQVLCRVGFRRKYLFRFSTSAFGSDVSTHPWVQWADVIHIHWAQQGFLSLKGWRNLLRLPGKRCVVTLHDYFPLTGGCHYPYQITPRGETKFCTGYLHGCGSCPLLRPNGKNDLSARIARKKQALYAAAPLLTFTGVSRATVQMLRTAPLTAPYKSAVLPNVLDTALYAPAPSAPARRPYILWPAARIDDPIKGPDLCRAAFKEAVRFYPPLARHVTLCAVGRLKHPGALDGFPVPVELLSARPAADLVPLYRQALLTLSASRQETFGQTLAESLACGTPAMAFNCGGPADIIRPEEANGYLIPPFDTAQMGRLIAAHCCPGALSLLPPQEQAAVQAVRAQTPQTLAASVQRFSPAQVIPQLIRLYQG